MNLIETVEKGEISFSFTRKFTRNLLLIFFDCGVETASKFYEIQHIISTLPTLPPSILEKPQSVTRLPGLLWTNQRFIHFLTKRGELFTGETKGWLS